MMIRKFTKWMLILVICMQIFGCAPTKNASYFRHYKTVEGINNPDRIYYIENDYSDHIGIGDELFISVSSGNDEPNSFNQQSGQIAADIGLVSFVIDPEGYIKLPYVDKINLVGLDLNKAADTLEAELSQFIYLPTVTVRFANSRITVLGEVNSPGVYSFNRKTISLYQALGYAGDVSIYGNRKKVTIVRQEGNSIKKKQVDITNDEILTSYWYNIYPNDIIYVEPLHRKSMGIQTFPYELILSLVSSVLLIFTFTNTPIN